MKKIRLAGPEQGEYPESLWVDPNEVQEYQLGKDAFNQMVFHTKTFYSPTNHVLDILRQLLGKIDVKQEAMDVILKECRAKNISVSTVTIPFVRSIFQMNRMVQNYKYVVSIVCDLNPSFKISVGSDFEDTVIRDFKSIDPRYFETTKAVEKVGDIERNPHKYKRARKYLVVPSKIPKSFNRMRSIYLIYKIIQRHDPVHPLLEHVRYFLPKPETVKTYDMSWKEMCEKHNWTYYSTN